MQEGARASSRRSCRLAGAALAALSLGLPGTAAPEGFPGGVTEALGPRFRAAPRVERAPRHALRHASGVTPWLRRWNAIALDASGLDHTPPAPGEDRVFGEQFGPGRSSRAMAIVHIAVFDALNAIDGGYESYTGIAPCKRRASPEAAIAQAAHDALVAVYPSQAASFDADLAFDLGRLKAGPARAAGMDVGRRAAAAILALRSADGSQHEEPRIGVGGYLPGDAPGSWRPDPISRIPRAIGAHWGEVTPFVLEAADQFRAPPPPALTSPEYAAAFEEVKAYGGDGAATTTLRSDVETEIGIFWAYDGTPSLCAPPRLYNQIALQIADQMGTEDIDLARLLALLNTALADAGIAIWESKYH